MTTTDLFFAQSVLNLKLIVHESRCSTDASVDTATTTPDQQLARAIERSGHGRNWPYLLALSDRVAIRKIRATVERYGFTREAIVTTCTTHAETLSFTSPGARTAHEIVRFDPASGDDRSDVERGALAAARSSLGRAPLTVIRVTPTDRGAEAIHQIAATLAREHGGVVVKWSGRTGDSDAFDVLRP